MNLRMKSFVSLLIVLSVIAPSPALALDPQPEPPMRISVEVNRNPLVLDVAPVNQNGRVLVPLRAIFESLGAAVEWNAAQQRVTASLGKTVVTLQIGNQLASITKQLSGFGPDMITPEKQTPYQSQVSLDVAPVIVDGRTLVPVRFVSEALGAEVSWDGQQKKVTVDSLSAANVPDLSGLYQLFITQKQSESRYVDTSTRSGTILVLVNAEVYPLIKGALSTYTQDLKNEGFSTDVYSVEGTSALQMKQFMRKWYIELSKHSSLIKNNPWAFSYGTGAVLVGDLPVPFVHLRVGKNAEGKPYEGTFPADIYLTDMDGNWDYFDADGVPFISTVDPSTIPSDSECVPGDEVAWKWPVIPNEGKSAARPEIFLGRIAPGTISQDANGMVDRAKEAKFLNEYFARNHAYRLGQFPYVEEGKPSTGFAAVNRLLYYDNDWSEAAPAMVAAFEKTWSGPTLGYVQADKSPFNVYVNDKSNTTASKYTTNITDGHWLWVEALAHSWPGGHEFGRRKYDSWTKEEYWINEGYVVSSQIIKAGIKSLFYNLQGCDTSDFSKANNIGTTYLFSGDTLAVIGNTTVGPHETSSLHSALGQGFSIGQAFMINQRSIMHHETWVPNIPKDKPEAGSPKRYYSLTLLGDPTLHPAPIVPKPSATVRKPVNIGEAIKPLPAGSSLVTFDDSFIEAVRKRFSAELPHLGRRVGTPPDGVRYLTLDRPIIDPNWSLYANPPSQEASAVTHRITLLPASQSVLTGKAATLNGVLSSVATAATGAQTLTPAAGKVIQIYEIDPSPIANIQVLRGTVITLADGSFSWQITPTRSSRYRAVYLGADGNEFAASPTAAITITDQPSREQERPADPTGRR